MTPVQPTQLAGAANHYDKYTTAPLWLLIWLICLLVIGGLVAAAITRLRSGRNRGTRGHRR